MSDRSFVELIKLDPSIQVFLPYATAENFVGRAVYPAKSRAYLRPPIAEALIKVQQELKQQGLGLKIWDAYRPFSVQEVLWKAYPHHGFVAEPIREKGGLLSGSDHNRGAAVDLTLIDDKGVELEMPTPFDEFSERAHRTHKGTSFLSIKNRNFLEKLMHNQNFRGLPTEWWHFRWIDAENFALADTSFEELASLN